MLGSLELQTAYFLVVQLKTEAYSQGGAVGLSAIVNLCVAPGNNISQSRTVKFTITGNVNFCESSIYAYSFRITVCWYNFLMGICPIGYYQFLSGFLVGAR